MANMVSFILWPGREVFVGLGWVGLGWVGLGYTKAGVILNMGDSMGPLN